MVSPVGPETQAGAEAPAVAATDGKDYLWYEMGFFSSWGDAGRSCRVTCIDTPPVLQTGLEAALQKQSAAAVDFRDPFAMHAPLIDQIIVQYDLSVWRVRHPVRKIEKVGRFRLYDVCCCVFGGGAQQEVVDVTIITSTPPPPPKTSQSS
jgi:hypothetical protein